MPLLVVTVFCYAFVVPLASSFIYTIISARQGGRMLPLFWAAILLQCLITAQLALLVQMYGQLIKSLRGLNIPQLREMRAFNPCTFPYNGWSNLCVCVSLSTCATALFWNGRECVIRGWQATWLSVMDDVTAGRWSTGAIYSQLGHLLWSQRLWSQLTAN